MSDLMKAIADDIEEYLKLCSYFNEEPQRDPFGEYDCYCGHAKGLKNRFKEEENMSSGDYVEGNCKECGTHTKGTSYQSHGLCLACYSKSNLNSKDDETLIEQLKVFYDNYRTFNKVKSKLESKNYIIQTEPELKIWKEL